MKKDVGTSRDPDILAADKAMRRAARYARALAIRTGTPFWVIKNGKLVNLNPAAKLPKGGAKRAKSRP